MIINELKQRFESNKEVKFKLYSLEYIIKEVDNKVAVYALLYESRKSIYNSLEEALNNFTIYNESIIDNMDRLILL